MTELSTTMPLPAPSGRSVRDFVTSKVTALQRGALNNTSDAVAALARLRRALGKPAGSVTDVLPYTLGPELAGPHAPDAPTPAETAAHLALTLYSLHQQGVAVPMHRLGPHHGLGRAARQLIQDKELPAQHPVVRRFQTLGSSSSLEELAHHARGLVQQLRAEKIPLDYGLLAEQLWRWQRRGGPDRVRLVWGRDFYLRSTPDAEPTDHPASHER